MGKQHEGKEKFESITKVNLIIVSNVKRTMTLNGKERRQEEEDKLERELTVKTLIISDSTLRLTNQYATNADITCISGGKLGHMYTTA